MAGERDAVIRHYGTPEVLRRLFDGLGVEGREPAQLKAADLRGMDQLHGGGFAATEAMAALAGVAPRMRVLDAGSGLGGTSRYLAESLGAEVEAVDLTPGFVEAAEVLNRLCGLEGRIRTRVGSVTALPFGDGGFDLVWSHNVAMNVSDKAALFAEAFRVLRPGGRLVFAMLAQGEAGPPHFPLPWAREPSASFLATPEEVLAGMEAAGFEILEARRPPPSPQGSGSDAGISPQTAAMGDDMAQRGENSRRSVAEGRLQPLLVLAQRPG